VKIQVRHGFLARPTGDSLSTLVRIKLQRCVPDVDSFGCRLQTILVVNSAENWLRDDLMAVTNSMAVPPENSVLVAFVDVAEFARTRATGPASISSQAVAPQKRRCPNRWTALMFPNKRPNAQHRRSTDAFEAWMRKPTDLSKRLLKKKHRRMGDGAFPFLRLAAMRGGPPSVASRTRTNPSASVERGLQRFKSLRHAARFCSVFRTVCNPFRPGRHALSAPNYRTVMRRR
jgi:hypothetical protein